MASPRGLEPPAHSLGNCCSILMSYGDVALFYSLKSYRLQELYLYKIFDKNVLVYMGKI